MVVLRALGRAEIETPLTTLTPSQEVVFAAALYLILEGGKNVSRASLASILWPRIPEAIRAHRLRQTILQLKKLGIVVFADRDTLRLSSEQQVQRDTDSLSTTDPASALGQDSLQFLPGYSPRLSESLRDWIETKRSQVHAIGTSILVGELERARLQGDWCRVEVVAAKCMALDAYNEVAVLAQAEASAMRGGKRQAVSILDRYIEEVGVRQADMRLPASLLRRRVIERIPERAALLNTDPPFVGRELETETLTRKFNAARQGRGSAVLVTGEPGIGKTRLSSEVARFAELQGAQVQRASCRRTDVDRPLSLFVDIVPQLRDMPGALGCAPESFASLKRLTEFEDRPSDTARQADSDILFQNLRTALFDLLESVTDERCLMLLIEDVQWLDDASAKILIRMVERFSSRRLFFLLNARSNASPFLDYAEKARVATIALGPLAPGACTALLQSMAVGPSEELATDFVNWCLCVAEGNPFFLQELVHQWIETGQRHDAPPSVSKVLQERLSRLSPEALHVLQACAVLGDLATIDRVEGVLQYHSHQLLSAVEELSNAAMLVVPENRADATNNQLQARHDFLSSAATGRLASISLAFLHRRSAEVLEQEISQDKMSTTLLWACARHRHNAGDRERALSLSTSCAEHLLKVGLTREACAGFEQSFAYCTTDDQRLKLLPRLANGLELAGEWEKSKNVLRTAIQLCAKQDSAVTRHNDFELLLLEARHRSALDFATLLEDAIICVESQEASPVHRVGAAVLAMKLAIDFGRLDSVRSVYSQVTPLFGRPDINEHVALEAQIIYRTECGDGFVPSEDLQRYAEVARLTGKELSYSRALLTAASACRLTARYAEGMAFLTNALEHARVNKLHSRYLEIANASVLLHIAACEFQKAREALSQMIQQSIVSDNTRLRNEIHCNDSRIAMEEGDFKRAIAAFDSIERGSPTFSAARKAYYLALEIRIRISQGAAADVLRALIAQLEDAYRQIRVLRAVDFESYSLYLALSYLGERDRGVALLRQYVADCRAPWWPLPAAIRSAVDYHPGPKSRRRVAPRPGAS